MIWSSSLQPFLLGSSVYIALGLAKNGKHAAERELEYMSGLGVSVRRCGPSPCLDMVSLTMKLSWRRASLLSCHDILASWCYLDSFFLLFFDLFERMSSR